MGAKTSPLVAKKKKRPLNASLCRLCRCPLLLTCFLVLTTVGPPSITDKAALLTFPNENRFSFQLRSRIQVKQPAVIACCPEHSRLFEPSRYRNNRGYRVAYKRYLQPTPLQFHLKLNLDILNILFRKPSRQTQPAILLPLPPVPMRFRSISILSTATIC
jgi:hypothetical protein